MRRSSGKDQPGGGPARRSRGQTMAEYATLLGVLIIAVAAVFARRSPIGVDAKLQNDLTTILSGM